MRLCIILDSDYNVGERVCLAVVMKDGEHTADIKKKVEAIKEVYYKMIEKDNFAKDWCLETYVRDRLERLYQYQFIYVGGEIDLS